MKIKERISKFTIDDYILLGFATLMVIVGLYFAIAMTVTLASGLSLFGSSDNTNTKEVEVVGPTSSDILVVVLIWILTLGVLSYVVFHFFFKKLEKKETVHKEIVNGRTVYLTEDDKQDTEKKE